VVRALSPAVLVRAALVLGASAALVLALLLSAQPRAAGEYRCPMHPSVVSANPGSCPLCGMALVAWRLESPALTTPASERVQWRVTVRAARVPAWVDQDLSPVARLDAEDVEDFRGQDAMFHPADAPDAGMALRAPGAIEPSSTSGSQDVRFSWAHRSRVSPPAGTVGWIARPMTPRPRLLVRASSVLNGAEGAAVLVLGPDGSVARRKVDLGHTALGFTTVLSGLSEGERVIGGEAFFLDAELRRHEAEVGPHTFR